MSRRVRLFLPFLIASMSIVHAGSGALVRAAADGARLPRTDFPACSAAQTTYCISEVVLTDSGVTQTATWVPTGTATLDASGAANTKTFTTFGTASTTYTGRWSYKGFPVASREFDGVYVKVAPANEFTDTMSVNIEPAGPNASGVVGRVKDTATSRVTSLPADMRIKVTVRLGELNPAVTIAAGTDVKITRVVEGTVQVMTFEGNPIAIAQASSTTQCDSETSVAVAKPNQFYALVAFKNGRDPFGVDGLSGDMVVSSNGTCKLSTPTWNESAKSMDFTSAAPHFAPDGTTVNIGTYQAVIPAADADLLFGLSSVMSSTDSTTTTVPAGTTTTVPSTSTTVKSAGVSAAGLISATKALTVEVRDTGDAQVSATRKVSFDGSKFVVSANGFTFSTKVLRMTMGTPPNAPAAVGKITTKVVKKRVTVRFGGSSDAQTQYQVYLAAAKSAKSTVVKCTQKGTQISCTLPKLKKGKWNVSVTPVKDGMAATTSKKTISSP